MVESLSTGFKSARRHRPDMSVRMFPERLKKEGPQVLNWTKSSKGEASWDQHSSPCFPTVDPGWPVASSCHHSYSVLPTMMDCPWVVGQSKPSLPEVASYCVFTAGFLRSEAGAVNGTERPGWCWHGGLGQESGFIAPLALEMLASEKPQAPRAGIWELGQEGWVLQPNTEQIPESSKKARA